VRTAAKWRSARGGAFVWPGAAERLVSFIRLFGGALSVFSVLVCCSVCRQYQVPVFASRCYSAEAQPVRAVDREATQRCHALLPEARASRPPQAQ
jgi:hypothetical protein